MLIDVARIDPGIAVSSTRFLPLGPLLIAAMAASLQAAATEQPSARFNVLFVAIDDLRPALGCYGDPVAITPHIDQLAARGTIFRRAYCQQAVCSPSRLSLLTGRRPDTIRVWDLATHFREAVPDAVTLPQYFKQHGYHTQGIGKIFHGNGKPSKDPPSWSVEPQFDRIGTPNQRYALPANLQGKGLKRSASESADVADDAYLDGLVCNAAIAALAQMRSQDQPFFLAVGFRKPHLPFCAPKKYWDLYDREKIPLPAADRHPRGAPELAVRSWMELEGYSDILEDRELSEAKVRQLRHGYYACVSYVDTLFGRLMHELRTRGLANNTIVVLWGDHGYHLGEQGLWTKANNYELSTRVPLIISLPGQSPAGAATDALVEFVDVYPTLADICGLDTPPDVEGVSLRRLLANPDRDWKTAVFSQYPRSRAGSRHRGHGDIMGYAVRTDRYRYVEWQDWETKQAVACELYDHQSDPLETCNLYGQSARAAAAKELKAILADGWKAAGPM
jgi:iduronate 2-sulfatase